MARADDYSHMTSPWQHIMCALNDKNGVSDTPLSLMRRRHPPLRGCRDNAKLASHCTARYKIEWNYMRTKVRGSESLELALEMRKKEREMAINFFFEYLVLAYTIEVMDDLGLG